MDWLHPDMTLTEVNKISMLGLAHVGDAVYELLVRTLQCETAPAAVDELHRHTVAMVAAPAQAAAAERLLPLLTDEELAVYKRGRNAKVYSVPHSASIGQYHAATGLEALFGWLHLLGRRDRVNELFSVIVEEQGNAT